MNEDRRSSPRLVPEKLTYVALRPHFSTLGKIVDISRGGLCFQYLAVAGQGLDGRVLDMDLFVQDNGYYLPELHAKLVYETVESQVKAQPVELEYRKCGIQFHRLRPEQSDRLDNYLDHYALAGSRPADAESR
jgi:hypothetical protein